MTSIKFFWWKQGWDKRTILCIILIIMPLFWQNGWFEWKFKNLSENVDLWYVSNIILLFSIIILVSNRKFKLFSVPIFIVNSTM